VGTYTITGKNIAFNHTASTMMACPPILGTLEKYLNDIITRTKQLQLKDNVLEFIDDKGVQIALFEAVYL
jgi:heat shock protein HslJ